MPYGSVGGSGGVSTAIVPTGAMLPYGGAAPPPTGYILCDGAAISRATFAELFAVIGTQYGVGDGSTTFNVPDMKTGNLFPRGATNDAGRGTTGGSKTHTLTIAQLAAHTHLSPVWDTASAGGSGVLDNTVNGASQFSTGSTGSGSAHNNEPQFVDFNFIIKS